ncbi:hypothetical protein [Streptomyces sp. NBC_01304]|uniref:hypothetical protein n=1 Tax=Streptomyces sp. NBC_01304 TaxID=2903818 RepID=UPI002E0F1945|nr:hypothetical protein OG430_49200 [Streptomyces sp. NBC_01304]
MTTAENTEIRPVELDGITGLEDDAAGTRHYHASMARWQDANPDADDAAYREEALRLIGLNDVLRRYNTLRYRLVEEEVARALRDEALQLVETLWQLLGDRNATGSWLHTHQAYMRALDDVRITVDMWRERAVEAAKVVFIADGTPYREEAHRRILDAGHPDIQPRTGDPATETEQLLANHEQAAEHRDRLLAKTLDRAAPPVPTTL